MPRKAKTKAKTKKGKSTLKQKQKQYINITINSNNRKAASKNANSNSNSNSSHPTIIPILGNTQPQLNYSGLGHMDPLYMLESALEQRLTKKFNLSNDHLNPYSHYNNENRLGANPIPSFVAKPNYYINPLRSVSPNIDDSNNEINQLNSNLDVSNDSIPMMTENNTFVPKENYFPPPEQDQNTINNIYDPDPKVINNKYKLHKVINTADYFDQFYPEGNRDFISDLRSLKNELNNAKRRSNKQLSPHVVDKYNKIRQAFGFRPTRRHNLEDVVSFLNSTEFKDTSKKYNKSRS